MSDLISIIVPVFNTDKEMFDKCLESLLKQTYENVEIILVDDGSDNGIEYICDLYAKLSNKVKVFHKKNGGLSSARNYGEKKALGKWLMFVDSDDWVDEDICEIAIAELNKNNNIDVAVLGYCRHNGEKIIPCEFKHKDKCLLDNKNNSLIKEALEFPSQISNACWKVYSTKFLKMNNLYHDEDLRQGSEDLEFIIRVLQKCNQVIFINKHSYHYIMNVLSITNSFNEKNAYFVIDCFETIYANIVRLNDLNVLKQFYVRAWYAICASVISGFMNPRNHLRYNEKKSKTLKFLNLSFCKKIMSEIQIKELGMSRAVIYICVKCKLWFLIYLMAIIRGKQKNR